MKRIIYVGLFLLFTLVALISTVNLSFSISTYEIRDEGEYYIPGGTSVRMTKSYCKVLKNNSDGSSQVYRDNSELIKIPTNTSNYLLKVKFVGREYNGLRENECNLYEYNAPSFDMTCTANSIGSGEYAFCDLYVKTSNYGITGITLNKVSDNLSFSDFDSLNFNMSEYNNNYTFSPKNELRINYKYLVGTLKVTNNSKPDGVDNTLKLSDIYVKDAIASFKVDDVEHTFMEGKIDSSKETTETTIKNTTPSPKTNIEYKSAFKNISNKTKLRFIIILFIVVIFSSISLGFMVIFIFRNKR